MMTTNDAGKEEGEVQVIATLLKNKRKFFSN